MKKKVQVRTNKTEDDQKKGVQYWIFCVAVVKYKPSEQKRLNKI